MGFFYQRVEIVYKGDETFQAERWKGIFKVEIDHIGYIVRDIGKASAIFLDMGFEIMGDELYDSNQKVNIMLLKNKGVVVELVSQVTNVEGPIEGLLSANGPMPYHICFKSRNMQQETNRLKELGFRVLIKPVEAVALNGTVSFMYHREIGIIELVEKY